MGIIPLTPHPLNRGYMSFTPGLAGVIAAESSISSIDGQNGVLRYRGIRIEDLAEHSSFEEVVYLLMFGELPTASELKSLDDRLRAHRVASLRRMRQHDYVCRVGQHGDDFFLIFRINVRAIKHMFGGRGALG